MKTAQAPWLAFAPQGSCSPSSSGAYSSDLPRALPFSHRRPPLLGCSRVRTRLRTADAVAAGRLRGHLFPWGRPPRPGQQRLRGAAAAARRSAPRGRPRETLPPTRARGAPAPSPAAAWRSRAHLHTRTLTLTHTRSGRLGCRSPLLARPAGSPPPWQAPAPASGPSEPRRAPQPPRPPAQVGGRRAAGRDRPDGAAVTALPGRRSPFVTARPAGRSGAMRAAGTDGDSSPGQRCGAPRGRRFLGSRAGGRARRPQPTPAPRTLPSIFSYSKSLVSGCPEVHGRDRKQTLW